MATDPDISPASSAVSGALTALADALGSEHVLTGAADLEFYGQDLMTIGKLPVAILRPSSAAEMADVARIARLSQLPLAPRGGGMSYSRAYAPEKDGTLILDFSRLNRVRDIAVADGHVEVEAGCTWADLDDALAKHGMRARFWGPMSGKVSTVGGSLSQGTVTFGSGVTGASANAVKSFEIVTGTGEILHTGSDGSTGTPPINRNFGPDLTGIFANDAGALGIKTAAVLEIEPRPDIVSGLSFAYDDFGAMADFFHQVMVRRLSSEIIAMDGDVARQNAGPGSLVEDAKAMWRVGKAAGSPIAAAGRMARIAMGGRRFLDKAHYTAHFVVEGRDQPDLASKIAAIRDLAKGGGEIVNTVPLMTRAYPFPELPVTHPDGRRMLPIHGIFATSRIQDFHRNYMALKADFADRMAAAGVTIAEFFAGVTGAGILYEPVFYWPDERQTFHDRMTPDAFRAGLADNPANPDAYKLVEELIAAIVTLMRSHGSTHFQLGRLYPYASEREGAAGKLLKSLKQELDPDDILNPGALGL